MKHAGEGHREIGGVQLKILQRDMGKIYSCFFLEWSDKAAA